MAKFRSRSTGKKKNGMMSLRIVVEKLQKSLSLGKKAVYYDSEDLEEGVDSAYVPADVKEGHFAVIAVDGQEPKRFVVPLNSLTHPPFLRLLEQAAEEYGFDHEGALEIPCRPSELESILAEQWQQDRDAGLALSWDSCKSLVKG